MKRSILSLALLFVSLPAVAQLQYFGYVGGGDDLPSIAATKNHSNFAHTAATTPQDSLFLAKVNDINSRGMKVTIDMSGIFFAGTSLRADWQQRWNDWKTYNTSILTSSKILAMTAHDEPLTHGVSLSDLETVSAYIKSDPNLSWLKIWYMEAACKVAWDNCGEYPYNNAFNNATSNIPHIDWVGLDIYYVHPATDSTFLTARDKMRTKFPGKKWIYVMDGFWVRTHADNFYPHDATYMATIADEWYGLANADANAVLLGVFTWPVLDDDVDPPFENLGSSELPSNVLQEHASIGRTITGKHRGPLLGTFSINSSGVLTGWVCDSGQTVDELNPQINIMVDGGMYTGIYPPFQSSSWFNQQCGAATFIPAGAQELAHGISITLPAWTKGKSVSLVGAFVPGTIASSCPQTPACTW